MRDFRHVTLSPLSYDEALHFRSPMLAPLMPPRRRRRCYFAIIAATPPY
jgi:hypothetical protein